MADMSCCSPEGQARLAPTPRRPSFTWSARTRIQHSLFVVFMGMLLFARTVRAFVSPTTSILQSACRHRRYYRRDIDDIFSTGWKHKTSHLHVLNERKDVPGPASSGRTKRGQGVRGEAEDPLSALTSGSAVRSPYKPSGDQAQAIDLLVERMSGNLGEECKYQVLRGATGTGKTFVMANVLSKLGRPALILCHNKSLAAQLSRELQASLPDTPVELFVSYYNYYRPEAYLAAKDTYVRKLSDVNAELDAMRHSATRTLFEKKKNVVVVASVSCIYGLGLPEDYLKSAMTLAVGQEMTLPDLEGALIRNLYTQASAPLPGWAISEGMERGQYWVRPAATQDEVCIWPPYEEAPQLLTLTNGIIESVMRLEIDRVTGDEERFTPLDGLGGVEPEYVALESLKVYPARHHVTSKEVLLAGCDSIETELAAQLAALRDEGKELEASRLMTRVTSDLALMRETGSCNGIENYSRHFDTRMPGEPPKTLLDYFDLTGHKWMLIADESHVALPQLSAMYEADRKRKLCLVQHGFRLPSALDNRPLCYREFWERVPQALFVSATPRDFELGLSGEASAHLGPPAKFTGTQLLELGSNVVDMVLRPTHVLDPTIDIIPTEGQLQRLYEEARKVTATGLRTLAIALTKKDAEDASLWLKARNVKAGFIHSGVPTIKRADTLRSLQKGEIDVLVGVNLLREGLDLPEVALVAVLSADTEGFLRNDRALIQMVGRAARNAQGRAIFFADRITPSMDRCIAETKRRRALQMAHNEREGLTPQSTQGREVKSVFDISREKLGKGALERSVAWAHQKLEEELKDEAVVSTVYTNDTETEMVVTDVVTDEYEAEPEHFIGLRELARSFPDSPGVYRWKADASTDAEVLYVGKANSLRQRVGSYVARRFKTSLQPHSIRVRAMLMKARHIEYETTSDEHSALLLEARRIQEFRPVYNVLLRDGAEFPYICVDCSIGTPIVQVTPDIEFKSTSFGRRYFFGPLPDNKELRAIMHAIETLFDFRRRRFEVRYGDAALSDYKTAIHDCISILQGGDVTGLPISKDIQSEEHIAALEVLTARFRMRKELNSLGEGKRSGQVSSRDAVSIAVGVPDNKSGEIPAVAVVLQVRGDEMVARHSYPGSLRDVSVDLAEFLFRSVEKHYMRCSRSDIPEVLLTHYQLTPLQKASLQKLLVMQRSAEQEVVGSNPRSGPGSRQKIQVRTAKATGPLAAEEGRMVALASANAAAELERQQQEIKATVGALRAVQELLSTEHVPRRIECYDISHLAGRETYASRVVFIDGKPARHLYRKYEIRFPESYYSTASNIRGGNDEDPIDLEGSDDEYFAEESGGRDPSIGYNPIDDCFSMRQVVSRRFQKVEEKSKLESADAIPDVVLIDGGKAQLGAALKGLLDANVYSSVLKTTVFCALAKKHEHLFLPNASAPLEASADGDAMTLLRRVRDESHRFAVKAHRQKRSQKLLGTAPTNAAGAGKGRRVKKMNPT